MTHLEAIQNSRVSRAFSRDGTAQVWRDKTGQVIWQPEPPGDGRRRLTRMKLWPELGDPMLELLIDLDWQPIKPKSVIDLLGELADG